MATTSTSSTPTTIAVRSQPRPSLPVWTSFLASSSSVNGQNPEPVSLVPPEVESTLLRDAVSVLSPPVWLPVVACAAIAARAASGTRRSVVGEQRALGRVLERRRRRDLLAGAWRGSRDSGS